MEISWKNDVFLAKFNQVRQNSIILREVTWISWVLQEEGLFPKFLDPNFPQQIPPKSWDVWGTSCGSLYVTLSTQPWCVGCGGENPWEWLQMVTAQKKTVPNDTMTFQVTLHFWIFFKTGPEKRGTGLVAACDTEFVLAKDVCTSRSDSDSPLCCSWEVRERFFLILCTRLYKYVMWHALWRNTTFHFGVSSFESYWRVSRTKASEDSLKSWRFKSESACKTRYIQDTVKMRHSNGVMHGLHATLHSEVFMPKHCRKQMRAPKKCTLCHAKR